MAMYKGQRIPTCYATCSIGHKKDHNLPAKLKAISEAGFEAIELSMPDVQAYGQELKGKEIDSNDYSTLCEVGSEIKKLCQQHRLKVLMMQPFANFEGWPRGSKERKDAFERAEGWVSVMKAVGTDMLQVRELNIVSKNLLSILRLALRTLRTFRPHSTQWHKTLQNWPTS